MIDLNLPDSSCTGEPQPRPRHRPHTRRPQRSLQSVAPRAVSLCQSVVRSVLNRGNFLRCGNQRTQFGYSSDITRLYSWQSLTRFNHTRIQAGNIGTSASFQGLMKRTITCCLQDPTITRIEQRGRFSSLLERRQEPILTTCSQLSLFVPFLACTCTCEQHHFILPQFTNTIYTCTPWVLQRMFISQSCSL